MSERQRTTLSSSSGLCPCAPWATDPDSKIQMTRSRSHLPLFMHIVVRRQHTRTTPTRIAVGHAEKRGGFTYLGRVAGHGFLARSVLSWSPTAYLGSGTTVDSLDIGARPPRHAHFDEGAHRFAHHLSFGPLCNCSPGRRGCCGGVSPGRKDVGMWCLAVMEGGGKVVFH